MTTYNILLVDDDMLILKTIGPSLSKHGYNVTTAQSGEIALDLIKNHRYDLVITDLILDETDGIKILKSVKKQNPDTAVIILTGYGDITSAIDALRLNADDYLLKPCEAEEIFFRVNKCFEKIEATKKLHLYEKILPVCCVCKKIRSDEGKGHGAGEWYVMEDFIRQKAKIEITSCYCPDCYEKWQQEIEKLRTENGDKNISKR